MNKVHYHKFHRYLGLSLGIYFSILGLTGSLLVWHKEIDSLINPQWYINHSEQTLGDSIQVRFDKVINTVLAQYSDADECIVEWPSPHSDNFISICNTEAWSIESFIDPSNGEIIGSRDRDNYELSKAGFTRLIYLIHTEFLMGRNGEIISGLLVPLVLLLLIFGFMLWRPLKLKHLATSLKIRRARQTRPMLGELHRKIGVYVFILLLISALSAFYLIFPSQVDYILKSPSIQQNIEPGLVDTQNGIVGAIHSISKLPNNNEVTDIYFSPRELSEYSVYVKDTSNIRPFLGMTVFEVSQNNVSIEDFSSQPVMNKILSALFSTHNGEILRVFGRTLLTLVGITPLFFTVTGFYFWYSRKKKAR